MCTDSCNIGKVAYKLLIYSQMVYLWPIEIHLNSVLKAKEHFGELFGDLIVQKYCLSPRPRDKRQYETSSRSLFEHIKICFKHIQLIFDFLDHVL